MKYARVTDTTVHIKSVVTQAKLRIVGIWQIQEGHKKGRRSTKFHEVYRPKDQV